MRGSSYDGYGRCSLQLNICLSRKPHPLQREEGSGHTTAYEFFAEEYN